MSRPGPWQPGLQSGLPAAARPHATFLRAENILQSLAEIDELANFTGLSAERIAAYRPQRLLIHELLIRLSAEYHVSDGRQYVDLGINFRRMAELGLAALQPLLPAMEQHYQRLHQQTMQQVQKALTRLNPPPRAKRRWWRKPPAPPSKETLQHRALDAWRAAAADAPPAEQAAYAALVEISQVLIAKYGQLRASPELIAKLVAWQVSNHYASQILGEQMHDTLAQAARKSGFRRLPRQAQPVILNVKGASAAGKSTLRPLQQELVRQLGLEWQDFALISPDIWRKFLLDYSSLGEHALYAGACTGHELQCIDQKLDRHIAARADCGFIPHLLIDRFRFDSFHPHSAEPGSNLLTRFGARIFMFYLITPPDATVERAWQRGLHVGRYKGVEDLLAHNIEAYRGMPELFFTWALDKRREVCYEFLDNAVPLGSAPRTVAIGHAGWLGILDLERLLDIDRFCKINRHAASPDDLYPPPPALSADRNHQFLGQCVSRLPAVDVLTLNGEHSALQVTGGELTGWHEAALTEAVPNPATRAALCALFPPQTLTRTAKPAPLAPARAHPWPSLGQWPGKA